MRKNRLNLILVSGVILSILAACGISILITGLIKAKQTCSEKVHYSPRGYFKTAGRLKIKRADHAVVRMADGQIFIVGGNLIANHTANTEIYDPKTQRSRIVSPMHYNRWYPKAVLLKDGRILVVGGDMICVPKSKTDLCEKIPAEVYDPKQDSWTIISPGYESVREPEVVALNNGDALIIGGSSAEEGGGGANILKYDGKINQISKVGSLKFRRQDHKVIPHSEGSVLIFGGKFLCTKKEQQNCFGVASGRYVKEIELVDSHTNQSKVVGALNIPRTKLQATPLSDGKVLITGGFSEYVPNPEFPDSKYAKPEGHIEIFDPKTNQSSIIAQFEGDYFERTQVIKLPHDLLLFTGADTAFIFNPKTREIRFVDNLILERYEHKMVSDDSGQVYLIGGRSRRGNSRLTIEVLDTNRLLKEAE